jgi:serine phosphatase RsbU (regulator of sigma subunit)
VPVAAPWKRGAAGAALPLWDRAGTPLGVVQVWWPGPRAEFSADTRARLSAVVAGFADVLGLRLADPLVGSAAPSPTVFAALDEVAGSVLLVRPLRDAAGNAADFTIMHVSVGYVDPAGRPARELAGLTLLEAYPASMSGDGLFARANRILATGHSEHVPGTVTAPLTGARELVEIGDLHAAPFFAGVLFTWRKAGDAERLAELLGHAQRLGQMGAWEENLTTGAVRWTDSAFALFGLDPRNAAPISTADLHNFVIAADRGPVRRFHQTVLRQREPGLTVFRIVRPGDTVIRQIRVFAEPVVSGEHVVGLRGAFQDVSAHYHTRVALAATRDQLADTAQRAVEEHQLALRLQRAIMPPDAPVVEAVGVEVAVRYRPAEADHLVAGDWYDALLLPGKDLLVVVGDITGHGIDAVTGMIAARNALRGLAATGAGPGELLRHLNYAACHLTEGLAGTVVCGRYDPATRALRWARAGHLPPVLVRGGTAQALPLPSGVLLGMDPDAEYEEVELQMRGGDTLLLFTDGLIERRAGSISDALRDLTAAAVPADPDAASHADRILSSAVSDTGDDACLVALRILLSADPCGARALAGFVVSPSATRRSYARGQMSGDRSLRERIRRGRPGASWPQAYRTPYGTAAHGTGELDGHAGIPGSPGSPRLACRSQRTTRHLGLTGEIAHPTQVATAQLSARARLCRTRRRASAGARPVPAILPFPDPSPRSAENSRLLILGGGGHGGVPDRLAHTRESRDGRWLCSGGRAGCERTGRQTRSRGGPHAGHGCQRPPDQHQLGYGGVWRRAVRLHQGDRGHARLQHPLRSPVRRGLRGRPDPRRLPFRTA